MLKLTLYSRGENDSKQAHPGAGGGADQRRGWHRWLDEVQAVEAEGGNAVTRELFASHIGVPDDAYALDAVLKMGFAADMTVVRFVDIPEGGREGRPAEQADRVVLPSQTDVTVF
ncbi:hypothetical protein CRV24_006339 [Beauveria bassiana]|nr:hypothetical protein CRV24_006339 [Beauveria bassiana]